MTRLAVVRRFSDGLMALTLPLAACGAGNTVRVAGLTLNLVSPAEIDPMADADEVVVVVLQDGAEVARAEGPPGAVEIPDITRFGVVEVVVSARAGGEVRAAAYSGPITIRSGDELSIKALFLPVNEAIPLAWTPAAHRVGHLALSMPDRRVLLVGGRQPVTNVQREDSEWWDPEVGYDGLGPRLGVRVSSPGVARLSDGSWLIAGGDQQGGPSRQAHRISPTGDASTPAPDLTTASFDPSVCATDALGGLVMGEGPAEVYGLTEKSGIDEAFSSSGVEACAGDGRYVVTAGDASSGWGVLDLRGAVWPTRLASAWTPIGGVPDLTDPMVVALPDGRFWVAGGFGFAPNPVTRLIQPETGVATVRTELAVARVRGRAEPWRDGHLVLTGGFEDEVGASPIFNLEIHNPDSGPIMTVPVPVRNATTTVLPGGAVLYTGGLDEGGDPAGAWGVVPWVEAR